MPYRLLEKHVERPRSWNCGGSSSAAERRRKYQLEVTSAELKLETSTEKRWPDGVIHNPDLDKGEVVYRLRKDLKGNTIIRFPTNFGSAPDAYDVPYTPVVAEYVAGNYLTMRAWAEDNMLEYGYTLNVGTGRVKISIIYAGAKHFLGRFTLLTEPQQLATSINSIMHMYAHSVKVET